MAFESTIQANVAELRETDNTIQATVAELQTNMTEHCECTNAAEPQESIDDIHLYLLVGTC